jgi:hypothetical protein
VERVLGLEPLSEENQKTFDKIWKWFVDQGLTNKEKPQVTSDCASYHLDGLIGIEEGHRKESFPLEVVMLEEVLHYVLTSDDPKTSADFSPEFLQGILRIIERQLADEPHEAKREFQSMLIRCLWERIERGPR